MKTRKIKLLVILVVSVLIAIAPVYLFCVEYQKSTIYRDLSQKVKYIDDLDISVYEFPNRESAEKAAKDLDGINQFQKITIIPNRPTLVQGFAVDGKPAIEYKKSGTYRGTDKYWADIANINMDKSYSFSTYQLSEYLVRLGLVDLIEGEMIDFNKQDKDCIEILVTEDFGAGINEEIYFTVNGLDKDYKQVVVKAKIVGIVEKGAFLYGYHDYCGDNRMPEGLHEMIFDSETVFTSDISYLYEYEAEPNSLLDEEVPVFLLGTKKSLNNSTINALVTANNGSEVTQNATRIDNENIYSSLNISYGILVGSVIAIILILIVDIVLIKKLLKKDEDCVISEH